MADRTDLFVPKRTPFKHQADEFPISREKEFWCRNWEQGTAKTKITLDEIAWLYLKGEIDAVLVHTPNGIEWNWALEEIPQDLSEAVEPETQVMVWQTKSARTKWHEAEFKRLLNHDGLAFLCASYDAMMTEPGAKAFRTFMQQRRVMHVLDESQRIKTPGAKRTKRFLAASAYSEKRRVLSGTMLDKPFDLYSQLKFLSPDIWKPYGISNFAAFKTFFGIWELRSSQQGRNYPHCVAFKNLHVLKEILNKAGSRVTKDEVFDLPPKQYKRVAFVMNDQQDEMYQQILDECVALSESGETVTAVEAMVKLIRLRQVVCGYVGVDQDDDSTQLTPLGKTNPRLELLREVCEDLQHPAIIWASQRRDIDLIMELLGDKAVRYDGAVPLDERPEAARRFRECDDIQYFVANPQVGGEGLTLLKAKTTIYYSNSFKLLERQQSEDRNHRAGQTESVQYIDFLAKRKDHSNTVDLKILEALLNKMNVAAEITGDNLVNWV